ncbi:MAG: DUF998 domain-containing protein [Acidimicrobiales bacterium]
MHLLSAPSSLRPSSVTDDHSLRVSVARALAVAGALAYNWWVVVLFVPGLMPSANGFFSDLEATGRPDAQLMSDADLVAGLLMMAAFVLRGSRAGGTVRREWTWMVAFAAAGAIGSRYPYACSEGLSASCRAMEWRFQLPVHHYVHMVAGMAEFAALTTAAVIAMRRTRHTGTRAARVYAGVVAVLLVGYPLLGAVYLTDRLGTLVEPVFFVAFSVMVLAQVFEPVEPAPATLTWAERVADRGTGRGAEAPANAASGQPMGRARVR